MDDPGFAFKAPQRREAKRFEPPPWEQDAFEELQRKKAEAEPVGPTDVVPAESGPEHVDTTPATIEAPVLQGEREQQAETAEVTTAGETTGPALDEKVVIEMMARLAEDEPTLHDTTWKPALFSAMVVAAIGVVMVIWGVAAAVKTASAGLIAIMSALVLVMFGCGFVALALWTAVRTLRQRGVL